MATHPEITRLTRKYLFANNKSTNRHLNGNEGNNYIEKKKNLSSNCVVLTKSVKTCDRVTMMMSDADCDDNEDDDDEEEEGDEDEDGKDVDDDDTAMLRARTRPGQESRSCVTRITCSPKPP